MGFFSVTTVSLPLLSVLTIGAGIEGTAGLAQLPAPAFARLADATAQQPPWAHRVDLRPEVEPTMFQGTIEGVNPSEGSVTVRTDYGLTMILFSSNCEAITMLRTGDRVLLEADAQSTLTVTTIGETRGETERSPEAMSRLVGSFERCARRVM